MLRRASLPPNRVNRARKTIVKSGSLVVPNISKENDYNLDLNVFEREKILKQLQDLDANIDQIGEMCTNKKNRSNEENIKKFCLNKAMIDEELNKIKFKLSEALKNSTKEDLLKKLQHDLSTKRNQVAETEKDVESMNKILFGFQHKIERLKEENNFLMQEIRNSKDYQLYLQNKKNEFEELKKNQVTLKNLNTSGEQPVNAYNNSSEFSPEELREKQTEKLERYFSRTEEMLRNKILLEDKILREKYNKLKNLNNFKNPIQTIMRDKIKLYQTNQVSQMTEKVTNREIFFSNDSKDIAKTRIIKNNLTTLKNKSEDNNKLNGKDKKEIMKMMLEDEDMKRIIFSYLFD